MQVDEKWVFGSAAAPVCFAGVMVVGVVASVADVSSVPGEWIAHWWLFGVFGVVWFLPGIVASVIGGGLLIRSPRVGGPAALVGLGLLCAASLFMVVTGFVDAFSAPPPSDAPQFVSQLSVVEAFVLAVPFVGMAIGSANAGRLVVTTRGSTSPTSG